MATSRHCDRCYPLFLRLGFLLFDPCKISVKWENTALNDDKKDQTKREAGAPPKLDKDSSSSCPLNILSFLPIFRVQLENLVALFTSLHIAHILITKWNGTATTYVTTEWYSIRILVQSSEFVFLFAEGRETVKSRTIIPPLRYKRISVGPVVSCWGRQMETVEEEQQISQRKTNLQCSS